MGLLGGVGITTHLAIFWITSMIASSRLETTIYTGIELELMQARLEYIKIHGAKFLFDNKPPPAPGWPMIRGNKLVYR